MTDPEQQRVAALAAQRAGKPLRDIAVELFGRGEVDANWHAGGRLRSKLRFLHCRSEDAGPSGDGTGPRLQGRR